MNSSERVKEILKREGISGLRLCSLLNLKDDAIKSITSGKVKTVSQKIADGIVEIFPHYNKLWVLAGEGDMLVKNDQSEDNIKIISTPAEVEQELLRQEISLMREELSLMRQEHGMMREELTLMRQLITRSDLHFTIGMASEPTIPDDNT